MNLKIYLVLLSSLFLLAGCATAYQPRRASGGYTEINPYEDGLLVIFAGNGYTSSARASSYAYYRAAELARENNWDFFKIKNKNISTDFFKSRIGATEIVSQPVVTLYITPAETPENQNTHSAEKIINETLVEGRVVEELCFEDEEGRNFCHEEEIPFYSSQKRLALNNCGYVNPDKLDDYRQAGGHQALEKVLNEMSPEEVCTEILEANLRGRGGAGYPTGKKWQFARDQEADTKYIIANCDEGDPGAFMDRSLMEGDPHRILEGMIIGAYAVGASQGFVYIRIEYPLAIERLEKAIEDLRKMGYLGEDILNSGLNFDIDIRRGAGAFVCGEETALIHSIEGKRGMPRPRPPYPAQSGLWGKPTVINNVETLANIPDIINRGAEWYVNIGTENSPGTKVFALAGDVVNTGLVEVPMGITLQEVVNEIGGGVPGDKNLKAVQTGGPAGGCIPADELDVEVDFESLLEKGSMMGSGGMIVMDEDTCMVDLAKFFIEFSREESCGKCTP